MKRAKISLAVATLIAAAFGMLSAGATSPVPSLTNCGVPYDTTAPHLYKYCGDRWAKYPVHYAVSSTGLPGGITYAQFKAAVIASASAWNEAWPNQMPSGSCAQQVVLCYDQASPNKVSFADLGNPGPLAQTTTFGHPTITSGGIVVNSAKKWKIIKDSDYQALAYGEAIGAGAPGSICVDQPGGVCDYYDVQDVATHEFGHLLGLGHPGFGIGDPFCFPSELRDPADYQQTMYACTPKGETSKRTLAEGDILGLAQIFNDSM